MKLNRLSIIFLLLVIAGAIYLWQSNTEVSNKESILKAVPVKSIVYDNYAWWSNTEVVRVIYSYPRSQVTTNYFYVELTIPDEVINYLVSLANSKYANIEPKEGLYNPIIFVAKSTGNSFNYARIFNYKVEENSTYGIPKKILITLSTDNVPIDYNLIIVEFFRPHVEIITDQYKCINTIGQKIDDYKLEKIIGNKVCIEAYDELWKSFTLRSYGNARVVLSRDVYIPIYHNDSLFIKVLDRATYCSESWHYGVSIGLLVVMKDGSKYLVALQKGVTVDYYSDIVTVPVCTINNVDLSKFQPLRDYAELYCGLDWRNIDHIEKIYIGMNGFCTCVDSDLIAGIKHIFVGYLT